MKASSSFCDRFGSVARIKVRWRVLVGAGFVVVSTELRPAHLREPTMDRSEPAIAVEEMPEYHMERDVR